MKKVVAKISEKYVTEKTFEKTMASVANTLSKMGTQIQENTQLTKKMLEAMNNITEDNREYRRRSLESDITLLAHDRKIDDLLVRVGKLEKVK